MSKSTVERPIDHSGQTVAGTLRHRGQHILAIGVREFALVPVIILLLIIGAFINPSFLTAINLINVAQNPLH